MDNLSASLHYKKNQQGIDTKSTIINNVSIGTAESNERRAKILPPKHQLKRDIEPSAPPSEPLTDYPDIKVEEHVDESCTYSTPYSSRFHREMAFLNLLDSIKTELLTMNDKALLVNLIDQSKRIILPEDDLKKLVMILTGEPVELFTEDEIIAGCCGVKSIKAPFVKKFEKIISGDEDFEIKHNELFIKMQKRSISLDKVFVQ